MILPEIHNEIMSRLENTQKEKGVKIVLAIESGSRAWGFESPNSDYDVRFIYTHPIEYYYSVDLEEQRDVIEYPIVDDIDLNGWDIRKALKLFAKSNPGFIEWIQSPITYIENGSFRQNTLKLLPKVYACESGIYHYRSMAKSNHNRYLRSDKIPLKKYFYVLRPLLACQWIEKYHIAPPIEFEKLLALIQNQTSLINDIDILLAKKRDAPEMGLSDPVPSINHFIEKELERLEILNPQKVILTEATNLLNDLLKSTIHETQ